MVKSRQDLRLIERKEFMIQRQLKARGIMNAEVLNAFRKVPREAFLPKALHEKAYDDHPLPIGYGQTISQPYIVAFMTEKLEIDPQDRVLEVGTGSGYQTAILAELATEVYSIEIIDVLYKSAKERLARLGYQNVHLRHADGRNGWPERAPFNEIMVTAGGEMIPEALIEQLKEGGRLVMPVGREEQDLVLGRKEKEVLMLKQLLPVRFVPLRG